MGQKDVGIGALLGSGRAMLELRELALRAARVEAPVLILGETGTGKSLLARVIHAESRRRDGPFQAVNCAGVPESLFESEFFGHQRGAFTGAREGRKGILEQAQGGSVLLDEVGELTVPQQAKLLTALEEGEIRRLGGEGTTRVDVRVLAATGRDLYRDMEAGRFRRDLFHRLAVLICALPPLRARRKDISLLARRLLRGLQARHGMPFTPLTPAEVSLLEGQRWPGNIRELSHVLEAALIRSGGGSLGESLEEAISMTGGGEAKEGVGEEGAPDTGTPSSPESRPPRDQGTPSGESRPGAHGRRYAFGGSDDQEREHIRQVLDRCRGNKSLAARELGMARTTLRSKLRKYGMVG